MNNNDAYAGLAFTKPGNVADYITYLQKFRDGAADPGLFRFGGPNLFPANAQEAAALQPPPEDLSYPTSNPAYTASQCGYPLGDLNYFPTKKAAFVAAGGCAVVAENAPAESGFALGAAYPNPTSGRATVRYSLNEAATVTIEAYDALGRRVLTADRRSVAAGEGDVALDTSALPSGVYLLRMTAETGGAVRTRTGRLTVVK